MMENKKMRAEHPKKELAVDILYDIIGSILFGAGIYTFAEGGNFAPGGISGIALIMNKLWNLPVGTMTLILNIPLVIISYKTVGKRFLIKTARTMIISTIFVDLVFPMFPYYTGQRLLAAIYSGALLGLGMVLFYMRGSSSGGADFLMMTIKKKRPHMSLGRLTLLIDLIIILIGWPVFGDVDSVLYGLIAVFVCSVVIDKILYGIGAGTLAIMAGGDQEDFDAMKEYFDILGSSALLIGGSGSGSVTKLANQVIVNNTIAVVSEAFVLATKAGADPEKVYHAIRGGLAGSAVLDAKIPMIIERNFKPGGPIRINHKDIKNVVNTAHSIDVPIPYTAQLYEILQTLKIHGHMNDDHGGIVQYFEKLADVEVKKTEE